MYVGLYALSYHLPDHLADESECKTRRHDDVGFNSQYSFKLTKFLDTAAPKPGCSVLYSCIVHTFIDSSGKDAAHRRLTDCNSGKLHCFLQDWQLQMLHAHTETALHRFRALIWNLFYILTFSISNEHREILRPADNRRKLTDGFPFYSSPAIFFTDRIMLTSPANEITMFGHVTPNCLYAGLELFWQLSVHSFPNTGQRVFFTDGLDSWYKQINSRPLHPRSSCVCVIIY